MSYYLDPTYVVRVTMEDEEKEDEKMSKHQRFTAAREFFNSRKKLATFYEFVEDDIDGSAISSKKVIEVLKNLGNYFLLFISEIMVIYIYIYIFIS